MNRLARLFLAAPLALAAIHPAEARAPRHHARAVPVAAVYPAGMVSAADPRAAGAGVEMLRAGGSATDAAIAVMLALTVVEPQSSGIGGGGLYVETDRAGHVSTIDGRETAPAAAHPRWFYQDQHLMSFPEAVPGGTSVGVPGSIALAARAHAEHGRLPWARLFAPAIRLAQQGFAITPRLEGMLTGSARTAAVTAEGRALFYGADGKPLPIGTVVKNPALARTLSQIAALGSAAFYKGANAHAIVARVTTAPRNPEPMVESDLAGYLAKPRDPLCLPYRRYRVCSMGPPSSGGIAVLQTLAQLERFDLGAMGKDSPQAWHLIADSMRLAYADRARYAGDADFVAVPVKGLLDPAYLAARSALIDPDVALASVEAGTPPGAQGLSRADTTPAEEHGTSHIAVIDRAGSAVSYTSTIESTFGSGLMVGGYFLNNELTDFDFAPEVAGRPAANRVQGGKRPRSSMAPCLVFGPDGRLRMAVGAAGGATIPAQVIRAVIGVIDWKLSAQQAVALPVLFAPGIETVYVEQGSALEPMIPALSGFGHKLELRSLPLKANAIEVVDGRLAGAADPRSEGRAVGE